MSSVADDYQLLTESVAVVDRSEDGKLALTGSEAREFLTGQVTADVVGLQPGSGSYAALLTNKGKTICDLRVLHLEGELLLICDRPSLQSLFDDLRRHLIGFDVELHKRTIQQGLVSLIGPKTDELLQATAVAVDEAEHSSASGTISGIAVTLIRTNLGVDLVCEAEQTPQLLAALAEAGAPLAGLEAADILRIESGRPWLQPNEDPLMPAEAGIVERAVSFEKGCYVGQETVARLHWRGKPNKFVRGIVLSGEAQAEEAPITFGSDAKQVGRVLSVAHSPRFGLIALAVLRREVAVGDEVSVGGVSSATVVELPFALAASQSQ